MRIGIVVDSACDLPKDFFEKHDIVILPVAVKIRDAVLVDQRDEAATLAFVQEHVAERGHEAETTPFTVEQIRDLFLQQLVMAYDHVFCLTISKQRSQIHDNALQASYAILNEYKPIRQAAGHNSPFALRVLDTLNLFSGQGVSAVEAVRLRDEGATPPAMRLRLDQLARNTYGYMIPRDLYYLRNRARTKGDRSVGLIGAALGTALDIKPVLRAHNGVTEPVAKLRGFELASQKLFEFTAKKVREGLLTPTVVLSYGGDLAEMRALPGYDALRGACDEQGVAVYESVMSLTAMVNVGKGALGIGFAAPPHQPQF